MLLLLLSHPHAYHSPSRPISLLTHEPQSLFSARPSPPVAWTVRERGESGVRSQESGFQVVCQNVRCPVLLKGAVMLANQKSSIVPLPGRYHHPKVPKTATLICCATSLW